jgi:hypothetical protein
MAVLRHHRPHKDFVETVRLDRVQAILLQRPAAMNSNMASSSSGGAAVPQDIELIMQMVQGEMAHLPATVADATQLAPGEGVGETA